ncbi:MAG: hypothetical protein EB060_04310 [Proteobacteria bacterium]|nr:hypothetical protein [Pseudomonadota bacterium]
MSRRATGFTPVTSLPPGKAYMFMFPGREIFENRKGSTLEDELGRTAGTLYNMIETNPLTEKPDPGDYETLIVTADFTFPNEFTTWNMTRNFNDDPAKHFDIPAMEFVTAMWGPFIPDVRGMDAPKSNSATLALKRLFSKTGFAGISFGSVFMQQVGNALHHLMTERGYSEAQIVACTGSLMGLTACPTSDAIAKPHNIPTGHFVSIYDDFVRFRSEKNAALMDRLSAAAPEAMIMDHWVDPRTLFVVSRPPKREILSAKLDWIGPGPRPVPEVSHLPRPGDAPEILWEITGNRFPDQQGHDPRAILNTNRMNRSRGMSYFQTSPTAHIIQAFGNAMLGSCIECGHENIARNSTEWLRTLQALLLSSEAKREAGLRLAQSEQSFIEMVTDHTGKPQIWQGR